MALSLEFRLGFWMGWNLDFQKVIQMGSLKADYWERRTEIHVVGCLGSRKADYWERRTEIHLVGCLGSRKADCLDSPMVTRRVLH
jgi:hypothetical protein